MAIKAKLSAVADAIRSKTGKTDLMTLDQMPEEIASIQAGGSASAPVEMIESGVNFFDYDGTLIVSYTEEQAKTLTKLPTPPEHDGLVFQGWNYTLEEVIENADAADVGALYTSEDGATRLYVDIDSDYVKTVNMVFTQSVASGVTIDWGDGHVGKSQATTNQAVYTHKYENAGKYTIILTADDGCTITLGGSSEYRAVICNEDDKTITNGVLKSVVIGNAATRLSAYCFNQCYGLKTVVMPSTVKNIGNACFLGCADLVFLALPAETTALSFADNVSLKNVSWPMSHNTAYDYYNGCKSLRRIIYTKKQLRSTNTQTNMFGGCQSLKSIVIKADAELSDGAFQDCTMLHSIDASKFTANKKRNLFMNTGIEHIDLPDTIDLSYGQSFYGCKRLRSATIRATAIGDSTFYSCFKLQEVVFDADIDSIEYTAFRNNSGLMTLSFLKNTKVPTLSGTFSMGSNTGTKKILVPASLVDEWKTATNWASLANYIEGVEV